MHGIFRTVVVLCVFLSLASACARGPTQPARMDSTEATTRSVPDAFAADAAASADAASPTPDPQPPPRRDSAALPPSTPDPSQPETEDREPSTENSPPPPGPDGFLVCTDPPEGMVCIPGGPFVRGSDDGNKDERPRGEVTVSTFHIDRHEVTNAEFRLCMAAGACELAHHYEGFDGDDQPVVAVDWIDAAAYCKWVGKRLPTEAEWEKAARGTDGRTYPWGEDPPTCERAHYADCDPRSSKPVGSFPPGPWGLVDMAGNAYEWIQDWYSHCYRGCPGECGDDCFGTDPKGPCAGADPCPGHDERILRGGSWFWEPDQVRSAGRRGMRPESRAHRLGFRCAVDAPPPGPVGPPAAPPDPVAPLTAAERAAFWREEEEVLDRRPVDVRHWVNSNESGHALWFPSIAGLGGTYVGVGSDQNFSLFAAARSTFVWLMDYDSVVLQANRIYRALVLASVSPQEFLLRWDPFEKKVTEALVAEACADDEDVDELVRLLEENFEEAGRYFRRVAEVDEGETPGTWLADPALYRYVRRMFQEDRVRIVGGDLTREMPARIAAATKDLGVPLRVFYISNAEQYFEYDDAFRASFEAMPFDERSVILRTVSRWLPDHTRHAWHYQVEPAIHFVELLRGGLRIFADVEEDASYVPGGGLSWFGLEPPAAGNP